MNEPTTAEDCYTHGLHCKEQGNAQQALTYFNQALKLRPIFKEACNELAQLLETLGQFSLAVKIYEHLLRIEIDAAAPASEKYETLHDRAIALLHEQRLAESEAILWQALKIKWDSDALNVLGVCHKNAKYYAKAIAAFQLALAADNANREAALNLAKTYFEMKHYSAAITSYEQLLQIDPNAADALGDLSYLCHRMCEWEKAETYRAQLIHALRAGKAAEPFIIATMIDSASLQKADAERFCAQHYPYAKAYDAERALPKQARGDGKLRIGYLSADFHDHATAHLIGELFALHDRAKFSVHAFSYGQDDQSAQRKRLMESSDGFHDLRGLSDEAAADQIREQQIDVLIDLKGHTQGHRLGIAAHRPAPLQIHYLGFPGTTGASFIDYLVSDSIISPPGSEEHYSEKLIRLPHSYQINDRARAVPKAALPRSAYGLPEQGLIFADFNNAYKITPEVFDVWMRLLQAVEGSVLWLYETQAQATANLRAYAARRGIDPSRIISAPAMNVEDHLQRYAYVDLFLDTSPVCGHTTASDALWCGVPVVTMMGESLISRVAASLLYAVDFPELVAKDLGEYEALALSLARNSAKLKASRAHLIEGRMRFPLFDSVGTTRALEKAYEQAVALHLQGKPPESFSIADERT